MTGHPIRRAVAVVVAAALSVALPGSALAADLEPAAKQSVVKCDGKVATKSGTAGPDRIVDVRLVPGGEQQLGLLRVL